MGSMPIGAKLMGPGCPWWDMRVAWGEPNIKWCEATLCTWVNEPANAWSNLAYFAVALWCWRHWLLTRSRAMGRFAWVTLLVGMLSFAYHATNNFGTQLLDFVGMYVLVFLLVAVNLHRLGVLRKEQVGRVHWGLTVGATLLVPVMKQVHVPYQLVILFAVLVIVGTELRLARQEKHREVSRDFRWAVGLLAVGAACLVMDLTRVWCDPDNHWLQGHAAWHVWSALALLFAARHYSRLMERSGREEAREGGP
ncbi:ceramidase domain-containing protein [Hyalangium rubrum]|uniref:Ceramidase domain-containing protein n=1 Tax=Hyalangium rubrum TaxID=3103134 RepID=A0ABU5GV10_9BACT|nr:ceramidase domain-containing protein [Hyalangium sp. s54d21]MDY7224936.1 ceramidase domain-containing protein [Hyalangium sp. s54d21]